MMRSSDVSTLFTPAPDELSYRQGTVLEWDAAAGTNRVNVAGTVLDDLQVLGGLEATSIRVGDHVAVLRVRSQFFVLGRVARPDVASNVTVQVDNALVPLVQLAGGAIADAVGAEEDLSGSAGSDTGYVDLDTAGPAVQFTTFTGKWLLLMIAQVETSGDRTAARMSFTASGAQSISASNARSSLVNYAAPGGGAQSAIYADVFTGSPGEVTVTAKYRMIAPPATFPGSASWANRAVIVLPY